MGYPDSEDGLPASHVTETLTRTRALHDNPDSTHKPSMLLDAEKEQPIEVEVIFGEVVRMARERNVDIPVRWQHKLNRIFIAQHIDLAHRNTLRITARRAEPDPAKVRDLKYASHGVSSCQRSMCST